MSARSTEFRRTRLLAAITLAAVLAACSSSGVRDFDAPAARDAGVVSSKETTDALNDEARSVSAPTEVPADAQVSHERAIAALAAEDWFEAELELEQLTAAYPEFPGPYVNLAIVYQHDGRNDAARSMLEQALALAPTHPAANNLLGIVLRDAGEFDAAEASYRRVLQSHPDYALAHYNLGVLLDLYMRRPAEALAEYESFQALQLEPDAEVGRWIVDLTRRVGAASDRVARENSQ